MKLQWTKLRQAGGNFLFALFTLIVLLDPTNTVLGLKDKVFVLLCGYSLLFFRPSLRFVPHLLCVVSVLLLTYFLAEMQVNYVDYDFLIATFKGFSPLLLLLWIHNYDVISVTRWPSLLAAVVMLGLFIAVSADDAIEYAVLMFVKSHNEMIMMTHRRFLGFSFFGMYYKSLVCLSFAMTLMFFRMVHERFHVGRMLAVAIFTGAFLVSGTRATMLVPFVIYMLVIFRLLQSHHKARYVLYPVVAVCFLLFLGLVLALVLEKSEASNAIKYAHLSSYLKLFSEHPVYLLIGQGPATRFYSEGFHHMTNQTEWTYLELIRNYGAFSSLIFFVLLYPIKCLKEDIRDNKSFCVLVAYLGYLLIAGTNPLLVSSTGMLVLLSVYSYVGRMDNRHI